MFHLVNIASLVGGSEFYKDNDETSAGFWNVGAGRNVDGTVGWAQNKQWGFSTGLRPVSVAALLAAKAQSYGSCTSVDFQAQCLCE